MQEEEEEDAVFDLCVTGVHAGGRVGVPVIYIPFVCITAPVCFSTWLPPLVDTIIVTYGHHGN